MAERNADGTLKQTMSLEDDGWLREGGEAYRLALPKKEAELGRWLTDEEKEELKRSLTTSE